MIKLSKKAIAAITATSAVLIAGGTITASILIKNDQPDEPKKPDPINPLDRDKNYHLYPISTYLLNNQKLSSLISLQRIDNAYFYIIDETKFVNSIKTLVQETLQSIEMFKAKWNNYKLEINYKVESTDCIKVDIVWYLPDSKTKYFDQFQMILEIG